MRWPILVLVLAGLAAQPAPGRTLWVLQAPDQLIEYDAATFTARRSVPVPQRAFERPGSVAVNARGQVLVTDGDPPWFWDGRTARELKPDAGPDTARQWFLSAAGDALLALERRLAIERDADGGERFVRVAARVVHTDLSGDNPQTALALADLPRCECTTGACTETCPIWTAWAPDDVVGNFVVATRFIEGQVQSDYQQSVIHRRQGRTWSAVNLPSPIEAALAASASGDVLVAAVFDAGCCGWINESSDRLVIINKGTREVAFDEWARFDNRNYDASFTVPAAGLSPSAAHLAYTIAADAPKAGDELRLSSDGKPNPAELARIRKAVSEHPAVDIVEVGNAAQTRVTIAGAELVGWLDADQILVAQNGRLAVFDRQGSKRRDTPIPVRSAADAFLR